MYSHGQNTLTIDLNHLFLGVDSATYVNLIADSFIRDIFADTRKARPKIATAEWSNTSINGRDAFLEFHSPLKKDKPYFSPEDQFGDLGGKYNDLGIVFKTRTTGDIDNVKKQLEDRGHKVKAITDEFEEKGQRIKWTTFLWIEDPNIERTFRPIIEEKSYDFLKSRGFTDIEISKEITHENWREKVRNKKYDKLFDKITGIELNLSKSEFEYLAALLKEFSFSQDGTVLSDSNCMIKCNITDKLDTFRVSKIYLSLTRDIEFSEITISETLKLKIGGKEAVYEFNSR
jgi:hypothetical protein